MKRLHPPSEREILVAEGKYSHPATADQPAQVEQWEITRLPDEARIYRVDVANGMALWHLMVAPDGRPDRLQVRLHDGQGLSFEATFTFFDHEWMIVSGQQGQKPQRKFLDGPSDGWGIMWGPIAGRELALRSLKQGPSRSYKGRLYLLQQRSPAQGWLAGRWVRVEMLAADQEQVLVPAGAFEANVCTLVVPESPEHHVWIESQGMVVQWQIGDAGPAQLTWLRRF